MCFVSSRVNWTRSSNSMASKVITAANNNANNGIYRNYITYHTRHVRMQSPRGRCIAVYLLTFLRDSWIRFSLRSRRTQIRFATICFLQNTRTNDTRTVFVFPLDFFYEFRYCFPYFHLVKMHRMHYRRYVRRTCKMCARRENRQNRFGTKTESSRMRARTWFPDRPAAVRFTIEGGAGQGARRVKCKFCLFITTQFFFFFVQSTSIFGDGVNKKRHVQGFSSVSGHAVDFSDSGLSSDIDRDNTISRLTECIDFYCSRDREK